MTTHRLHARIRKFGPSSREHIAKSNYLAEIRRLKKERKRTTEKRDLPENEACMTDITLIRTHESKLYPAVVEDLFTRSVISWSMKATITEELVLNALIMAVSQRNPKAQVMVRSDQGSQYTSYDRQSFLREHGVEGSMSRRGNCHDNAVAESFFQLLK